MNVTWSWMKQVIACVSGTEIKILIKWHQEPPLQQFFFLFSFFSVLLCSEFPLIGSDIKLQSVWRGYTQLLPSFHITLHQTALINYHIAQKQETGGGGSAMESQHFMSVVKAISRSDGRISIPPCLNKSWNIEPWLFLLSDDKTKQLHGGQTLFGEPLFRGFTVSLKKKSSYW